MAIVYRQVDSLRFLQSWDGSVPGFMRETKVTVECHQQEILDLEIVKKNEQYYSFLFRKSLSVFGCPEMGSQFWGLHFRNRFRCCLEFVL